MISPFYVLFIPCTSQSHPQSELSNYHLNFFIPVVNTLHLGSGNKFFYFIINDINPYHNWHFCRKCNSKWDACFLRQPVFVLAHICGPLPQWSPLMSEFKPLKYTGVATTTFQSSLLTFSSTSLCLSSTHTQIHKQSLLYKPVWLSITRDVSLMD